MYLHSVVLPLAGRKPCFESISLLQNSGWCLTLIGVTFIICTYSSGEASVKQVIFTEGPSTGTPRHRFSLVSPCLSISEC
jgi:hypothetical protein